MCIEESLESAIFKFKIKKFPIEKNVESSMVGKNSK